MREERRKKKEERRKKKEKGTKGNETRRARRQGKLNIEVGKKTKKVEVRSMKCEV
jgi:hypothetical protein